MYYIRFYIRQIYIKTDFNIQIDDLEVSETSTTKFLGLIIHENVSWKPRTDSLAAKFNVSCFQIRQMRNVLNKCQLVFYFATGFNFGASHCQPQLFLT